jgi:hypothetical protein
MKVSKCEICNLETKELFEKVSDKGTKLVCKECRGVYQRFYGHQINEEVRRSARR